ncbi:LacI family DNA-binding transcriptional regulator [Candidatus Leptofilum sp.]|uniref:LacI family DNA-binding transcriptional regulator n=1 Tax=Candidatus Leptofilum sp. TaxID=3241576 RepID=UPI003B5CA63D
MAQNQVTSIDVARFAGVSQPTVSRAFDPEASVAPETRQRVLDAAKELGYQPNVIARSLSTQRTNIVGIVMSNLTDSAFYPNVLDVFTDRFQALGKQSLLFNAPPDRPVDDILPRILGYRVDALVIVSTTPSNEIIDECTKKGTLVILFNSFAPDTNAISVCCDNVAGGSAVADLLLDTGHKRIAFLAGIASTATNKMREGGFVNRLNERGYTALIREQGAYTYDSGYAAMRRLLALNTPPDAAFCAADVMALGAMDAARDAGLAVPDELSIVGFDDIPVAGWSAYKLTTFQQPIAQMVETAVSLITAPKFPTPKTHLLPGKLVMRTSVRQP